MSSVVKLGVSKRLRRFRHRLDISWLFENQASVAIRRISIQVRFEPWKKSSQESAGKTADPHASLGLRVAAESPPHVFIQPYVSRDIGDGDLSARTCAQVLNQLVSKPCRDLVGIQSKQSNRENQATCIGDCMSSKLTAPISCCQHQWRD